MQLRASRPFAVLLLGGFLLVLPASCGVDEAPPGAPGGEVVVPPPVAPTEGYAPSRDAFAPFSGQNLHATVLVAEEANIGNDPIGMKLELSADKQTLKVEIVTKTGTVAGPWELKPEPNFGGGYIVEGVSGWGATGLRARARVRTTATPHEIDFVLIDPQRTVNAGMKTMKAVVPAEPDGARREALRQRYFELIKKENLCNDLVRFATVVQDAYDSNQGRFGGIGDKFAVAQAVVTDLADLFIGGGYSKELLTGGTITVSNHIADPAPSCVDGKGYTGYDTKFKNGEGRFRHFSANAAAALTPVQGPGAVVHRFFVNIAARVTGGDFEFLSDKTGDIAADLATNAIGRSFSVFLRDDVSPEKPNDVRDWIMREFGGASPDFTSLDVILDEPKGPHPAGSVIGLCRVRGCHVAAPDMCPAQHVHDNEDGITIDEVGPYDEPIPPCGYGRTAVHPLP